MSDNELTLGSLFDGSGGFPLAGIMAGIKPIWSDEVEPFPIRVTEKRLPQVKHYGDICSLNGADLEPVDIITGGFPCQSVSVAGRRAGVKHIEHGDDETTRSGLVYEAIRIVKEMRGATNGEYPKYFIAENVRGLYSSGGGEDLRKILEEFCKIKDPEAYVPMPKKGKWEHAGCIMGEGYSIAWRLFNTCGWGLPQRRERIYIVADFADERGGEILFKPTSVSWHTPEGFRKREESAACASDGIGEAGKICLNDQGGSHMSITEDVTGTLRAQEHGHQPLVFEPGVASRCGGHVYEGIAGTLRANAGDNIQAVVLEHHPNDSRIKIADDGICQSLTGRCGTGGGNVPLVMTETPIAFGICGKNSEGMLSDNPNVGFYEAETSRTLDIRGGNPCCHQGGIAVAEPYHSSKNSYHTDFKDDPVVDTLVASDYKDPPTVCTEPEYILRRLTPIECLRLQGLPDWWCDDLGDEDPSDEEIERWIRIFNEYNEAIGRKVKPKTANQVRKWLKNPYSDSSVYKMAGNGLSIPIPFYILSNIADLEQ